MPEASDFRLEFDDPRAPLRRCLPVVRTPEEVLRLLESHILPTECGDWLAAGVEPEVFEMLPVLSLNPGFSPKNERFAPVSVEIDEDLPEQLPVGNYGISREQLLEGFLEVRVELYAIRRNTVAVDAWLARGEWPDPEIFLHRPDAWEWETEDTFMFPDRVEYGRGAVGVDFDGGRPRLAPCALRQPAPL